MLAASGFWAVTPNAADSHVSENVTSASSPITPSHSSAFAVGRNPIASATAITITMLAMVWIALPMTCPVRIEPRLIAIVRNRLTIPSVMSTFTATAVATEPAVAPTRMIPGAM